MIIDNWLLWAILSAIFAAVMTVCAKLGLRGVDPDFAQLVRTAVVLLGLAVLVPLSGKWRALNSLDGRTWVFLIFSGLATGASWLCYFRALNLGEASRVAAVDKLSVALVAVFSVVLLHERLGSTAWLGIALVVAGLFCLVK